MELAALSTVRFFSSIPVCLSDMCIEGEGLVYVLAKHAYTYCCFFLGVGNWVFLVGYEEMYELTPPIYAP